MNINDYCSFIGYVINENANISEQIEIKRELFDKNG